MRKIALVASLGVVWTAHAHAAPALDDYRHFRALTVDLVGRIPTRDEVAAFEKADFNLDAWLDAHLTGDAYADRVTRIYMDLLRLQVSPVFNALNTQVDLRRQKVLGPDGKPIYVYYRFGQRRARVETDGDFCLTPDETGLAFPVNQPAVPYPPGGPAEGKAVSQAVLDAATVVVKPWWLYRDYKNTSPSKYYDAATWSNYGFTPVAGLLTDADGASAPAQIRICKEEAQKADVGHVYRSGRTTPVTGDGGGPPFGRYTYPPPDDAFATQNEGDAISCRSQTGIAHAIDCGCGTGLEHCFPTPSSNGQVPAVVAPEMDIFGTDAPIDSIAQDSGDWDRLWWGEEARHFMQYLFGQDRDMREMLTAPYTFVNGPLMQYYKSDAPAACCGAAVAFGYSEPVPLFDPKNLPASLLPHDANTWTAVASRGGNASGIMTMPIFLTKYGTRRARAHALYNTFLCKDFIAPPNLQLKPSEDPNLMTRDGCKSCHATLEPMAAYFTRVAESSVTYFPADKMPIDTTVCKKDAKGNLSQTCSRYYDPAFSDAKHAVLRGAYPDVTGGTNHADSGPKGMAAELTSHSEFASCVAQNVATSFLGRTLTTEDAALARTLADALAQGGFKMRAVVKKMLLSDAYRKSNNLTSSAWRAGGAP
ncbi:DUF1585 domain-containing protein [Pendulispora rubella]|uniref:DUF1585 domain-containing protein n=1 Tax=Pendulispora rubella TaxID=2741070 RepID=A0ABZ2KZ63_9BACT